MSEKGSNREHGRASGRAQRGETIFLDNKKHHVKSHRASTDVKFDRLHRLDSNTKTAGQKVGHDYWQKAT